MNEDIPLYSEDDLLQMEAELEAIEAELERRLYLSDGPSWAEEKLGDSLWSVQKQIMHSVQHNRKTAVRSCHGAGKSYIAATTCGWWIDSNPLGEAFVVTSAPTGPQVRAILWREIGRVHDRGNLPGRVNQTEWHVPVGQGREELVAFGRKPADYNPTAFQGIHAPKVLVVFDEANGIPGELWDAADSLAANDDSRMLAIGNPDDPESTFKKICDPGSGWNVIEISAFITPNFTGEPVPDKVRKQLVGRLYVEEKRKKWAPKWVWTKGHKSCVPPVGEDDRDTHPYWQSKVLGRFPSVAEDPGWIPIHWGKAAQDRVLRADGKSAIGVDVGGGGDSSCGCLRRGPVFRILWEDKNPDTMYTCGNVVRALEQTHAETANIDMIGIGRGVRDRGVELKLPFVGINVGEAPYEDKKKLTPKELAEKERFANLRAQLWWNVRTMFEQGNISIEPDDTDLEEQLVSIRFKRRSDGVIQIESKADAQRRGFPSPNRADALMLASADGKPQNILHGRVTW